MPAHHWHPYYEMFYVETGACSYMVGKTIFMTCTWGIFC